MVGNKISVTSQYSQNPGTPQQPKISASNNARDCQFVHLFVSFFNIILIVLIQ